MDQTVARTVVTVFRATLSVAGCASASKDLSATYVSPNQYSTYDCGQLTAEAERTQTRVVQLGGRLDQAAQNDVGLTVVGMILFWPALFALGGTKQQEAEYSRLKGEYDAVQQTSIAKKCYPVAPTTQDASAPAATPTTNTTAAPMNVSYPAQPVAATAAASSSPPGSAMVPTTNPTMSPATPAAGTSTFSASVAPAVPASKYMVSAERFAKNGGCESPVAKLSIASSTYETFTITCAKGDPLLVRCDDGICRELK
jgi:hypothetical protein